MTDQQPFDAYGERGYVSLTVIPDQFTLIKVRPQPTTTVIQIGALDLHVDEAFLDRLEQATVEARAALAQKQPVSA